MKRILVIEDDSSVRSNLIELLNEEGYETFEAENGKIGINLAKKVHPHLIISDILMPEVNGYEVLLELQKNESTASIPFIFLSAFTDISNIKRGTREGADDYLTKPYKTKDFLNAVYSRLKKEE
ncbi:MAG: response regulator [Ignavibacteriaceae bacterium]